MRVSEAFPSKYLRAADLQGRTTRVVINVIQLEEVGTEGAGEHKPVIYFQDKDKGLVLNKTNAATIAMAYGDDTDGWGGADLELFPMAVPFNGQMVPAIRVRVPAAPAQQTSQLRSPSGTFVPNAANRQAPRYDERNPPPNMGPILDDDIPF